ncbi:MULTISPECIES: putative PEP-binding protein [Labrys]|uniref:Phosphoenolpyruvate-protein phosphotransferase n=1 Tax=Labrys neptuniae TaxID=376174 RepID=A0ABV3PLE0_9HYPH
MTERRMTGRPASPGLASGPVFTIGKPKPRTERKAPAQEDGDAALRTAIDSALVDLVSLVEAVDEEGADIIGFQIAMLEDEALSEGAFDAIAAGVPPVHAWRSALEAEIADYERSEDAYFRARGTDLADIRDRVLAHLTGAAESEKVPPGSVLVGEDLPPSLFLSVDWSKGGAIALGAGSPSSHVAMLARSRRVPMVTGLGALEEASQAIVDGAAGTVTFDPDSASLADFGPALARRHEADARAETMKAEPVFLPNGTRVDIMINVASPDDLKGISPEICDGIGLVRTEFLFEPGRPLPDEEAQYAAYVAIAAWADGRPVTIRTLDAGGDKPIAGVTSDGESNPFLGLRGLRLSLARPETFRVQLRALARASLHHEIRIMLPMVTVPGELAEASALLDEVVASLIAEGTPCRRPPLGIMVEVPAAALGALRFPADFYSIGSNDLTQYTMAAARDIADVAGLNDAGDPAVLELMARAVGAGKARKVPVSICGDAAGEVRLVPKLIGVGLTCLSVPPALVGAVKAAIADFKHV